MKLKSTSDIPASVRKFMPLSQQKSIVGSEEHGDVLASLEKVISKLPKTYETDGQGKEAIAYLHYFKGGSDWYITEQDIEEQQLQAHGYVILNGDMQNAEMGYINIEELKENNVDLDFFFDPISIREIIEEHSGETKSVRPANKIETPTVENAVEPSTKEADTTPIIDTTQIATDTSAPLEDKQIQNADITVNPYIPKSLVCNTVETSVPLSMLYEMNKAMGDMNRKVRGVDWFVCEKLGYSDLIDLCTAFSAEQVDAIAMGIYQIDQGKALVLGDQTGIGKGRAVSAIMKYAKRIGKKPMFFTEKTNLFSDIYRDNIAIGLDSAVAIEINTGETIERVKKVTKKEIIEAIEKDIENNDFELEYDADSLFKKGNEKDLESAIIEYRELYFPNEIILEDKYVKNPDYENDIRHKTRFVPFIVNGRDKKTDIKDLNGNIIYRGLEAKAQSDIFNSKQLPDEFDCILATYSQVSSPDRSKVKADFLFAMAKDNVIILDESQNASGQSNTGKFIMTLLEQGLGVFYASATFAKRPDNMPIYAVKTAMRDTELDSNALISAIDAGGVPLQEIVSSILVSEGQMIRRERSYEGIDVNYIYLNETQSEIGMPQFNLSEEHRAIADNITSIVRKIMAFQEKYVAQAIKEIDKKLKEEQAEAKQFDQQKDASINNTPVFSGIFQLITQLLFSLKADALADYAIMRMKQGKKPIIAFSSTLESFLDYLNAGEDETIKTDFSIILKRRLEKTLQYTVLQANGSYEKYTLADIDLGLIGNQEYESIAEEIENAGVNISISPIDWIIKRIKESGFEIGEVTGRNKYVEFIGNDRGYIKKRIKPNASDVFRKFNNNQFDCILINQSGAVGASAHAIKTDKVFTVNYDEKGNPIIPTSLDDKTAVQQRVMISLQAELDINKEVQKRGRPNRTGQVFKPIYDYLISDVPAEMRLMMMMQKKLKSLDANTTSNQKQSKKILDVVDFLNVYGDEKVVEFLIAHPEINSLTGNILKFEFGMPSKSTEAISDKAHKVSGRVAILPVAMQEEFYNTVTRSYAAYERQLKSEDKWTLEVEKLDLRAKTLDKSPISVGSPKYKSVFGGAVFIEKCEINNLRRPYSKKEFTTILNDSLQITVNKGEYVDSASATPKEITDSINLRLDNYISALKLSSINSWGVILKRDLATIEESKTYIKLKTLDEKNKFRAEFEFKINEENKIGLSHSLERIDNLENDLRKSINFFEVKRLVAYPFDGSFVTGICVGLRFLDGESKFTRSTIEAEILIPNSIRRVLIPLSSQMVESIMNLTREHHPKNNSDSATKRFIDEWDFATVSNRSERIVRYIITGNILKAFGLEAYSKKGKLISYTTFDNQIKKGILLGSEFKPEGLSVSVPIINAEKSILNMTTHQVFYIVPDEIHIAKTQYFWRLYVNKNSKYPLYKFDELTRLAVNAKWDKPRGENNYVNDFEQTAMKEVIRLLYERYKLSAQIPASAFESMKDQFDIEDREEKQMGENELINKYNSQLDAYEKEQLFVPLDESEVEKMDDLQKQLYDAQKEIKELRQIKHWYNMYTLLDKAKKKKDLELKK